jgi:hypothetical protein
MTTTTSIREWSHDQKLAVARLIQFILVEYEYELGTEWTIPYWQKTLLRIGLGPEDKGGYFFSTSLPYLLTCLLSMLFPFRYDILIHLGASSCHRHQTCGSSNRCLVRFTVYCFECGSSFNKVKLCKLPKETHTLTFSLLTTCYS